MKKKVLILGANGMLGSMMTDYLSQKDDIELTITSRNGDAFLELENIRRFPFAVDSEFDKTDYYDYVINCIGLIKPRIDESKINSVLNAIEVNSVFPLILPDFTNAKIIQIATDCVFSGKSELPYEEVNPHDATDVYGKTKSLGENKHERVYLLRCSIIGPEHNKKQSLMEWLLSQPDGSEVNGYTNHRWNGLTTLAFAKICYGIIRDDLETPKWTDKSRGPHIIPTGCMSKYELLSTIIQVFKKDIKVKPTTATERINRRLTTMWKYNNEFWAHAGYPEPLSIREMVEELYDYLQKDSIIWKGRFN